MKMIQAEVPESIYRQAAEMAEKEHVPLERLVSLALAQALGAWRSESAIAERAKRAAGSKFVDFMAEAPDVEPREGDRR